MKYNYMRKHKEADIGEFNLLGLEGWEAYAVDHSYVYLKCKVGEHNEQ